MIETYKNWKDLKNISPNEEVKPGDKLVWTRGDGVFFKSGEIVTVKELSDEKIIYNFKESDKSTMWPKTCFARLPIECPHPEWLGVYISNKKAIIDISWDKEKASYNYKCGGEEDNKTIRFYGKETMVTSLINTMKDNTWTKVEPYKPKRSSKLRVDVFGGFYD